MTDLRRFHFHVAQKGYTDVSEIVRCIHGYSGCFADYPGLKAEGTRKCLAVLLPGQKNVHYHEGPHDSVAADNTRPHHGHMPRSIRYSSDHRGWHLADGIPRYMLKTAQLSELYI